MKVKVKSLIRVRLFATPWTIACQAPQSGHGIFQARILEWAAISFSMASSQPRDRTWVSRIVGRRFYRLSHQGSPEMLTWFAVPGLHCSVWDLLPWFVVMPKCTVECICQVTRLFQQVLDTHSTKHKVCLHTSAESVHSYQNSGLQVSKRWL